MGAPAHIHTSYGLACSYRRKTALSPVRTQSRTILLVLLTLLLLLLSLPLSAREYAHFNWRWMFYEEEWLGKHETTVFRPLYLKTGTDKSFFQASLMPFIFWRYHDEKKDDWKWLFGFGSSINYIHKKGTVDFDFGFFPLLYFGMGTSPKERYFMFWPFGGTLKGKFGVNRLSAYIFPGLLLFYFFPPAGILSYMTLAWGVLSLIPLYLSYQMGDFKAWSILWPLIFYGKGGKRREVRIFPFYAHLHKDGMYDRYSYLFIFNYQKTFFSNDLWKTLFIFPLFGRKWSKSGDISSVTVLWPLFTWGRDKRAKSWELNAPWPFVQLQDSEKPEIKKRIFFPIFGYYRYEKNETLFFTPLYFRLRKKSYRFDSEQHIALVIFWYYKRDYHGKPDPYYGQRWRYFKMWPLFQVEYNNTGDFQFNLLSVLPFRDREGYEKLYQPFWSLIEYTRFRTGEKRLGLFFRTYFQRWSEDFLYIRVPFLFSLGIGKNRLTELTFFLSMFGYEERSNGSYIRLFWVPIRIKKRDAQTADGPNGETPERTASLLRPRRRFRGMVFTRNF